MQIVEERTLWWKGNGRVEAKDNRKVARATAERVGLVAMPDTPTSAQIGLKCLYLASSGRLDVLTTVNMLAPLMARLRPSKNH